MTAHRKIGARIKPNSLSQKKIEEFCQDAILNALRCLTLDIEDNGNSARGLSNYVQQFQTMHFIQKFGDSLARCWGIENRHGFNFQVRR